MALHASNKTSFLNSSADFGFWTSLFASLQAWSFRGLGFLAGWVRISVWKCQQLFGMLYSRETVLIETWLLFRVLWRKGDFLAFSLPGQMHPSRASLWRSASCSPDRRSAAEYIRHWNGLLNNGSVKISEVPCRCTGLVPLSSSDCISVHTYRPELFSSYHFQCNYYRPVVCS